MLMGACIAYNVGYAALNQYCCRKRQDRNTRDLLVASSGVTAMESKQSDRASLPRIFMVALLLSEPMADGCGPV